MPSQYITVLDAGSTGTRILIYRWDLAEGDGRRRPLVIHKVFPANDVDREEKPGLHQYETRGAQNVGEYLYPLLRDANAFLERQNIPVEQRVPIYLFGTAGMRGIPQVARQAILTQTWQRMGQFPRFNPGGGAAQGGIFPNVRVISGRAESLFAWIANNYGRQLGTPTSGIFEIGGDSAQIAFAPPAGNQQGPTNDICLSSRRGSHRVYSGSWDGLGVKAAKRTLETIINADDEVERIDGRKGNPCIPTYYETDVDGFTGIGGFTACRERAEEVLGPPERYNLPAFPDGINFVGVSNPMHSYKFFSELAPVGDNQQFHIQNPYNQLAFTAAATTYCNGENPAPGEENLPFRFTRCFNAALMLTLLRDSFPHNGQAVLRFPHAPADDGNDLMTRSSWTIGVAALVARHKRLIGCPVPGHPPLPIDPLNNSTRFGEVDWPPIFFSSDSVQPNFSEAVTTSSTESANVGIAHSNSLTSMSSPCIAAFSVILFALVALAYRRRRASVVTGKIILPTDMKETVA